MQVIRVGKTVFRKGNVTLQNHFRNIAREWVCTKQPIATVNLAAIFTPEWNLFFMPAVASGNTHQNLTNPVTPRIQLPPKPPVPESNNLYFLVQIRGNIAKCSGCNGAFKGACPLPPPDDNFIIGRKDKDWFLYTQSNREKYWKLGWPACICACHPYFNPTQLHDLIAALRMRFS